MVFVGDRKPDGRDKQSQHGEAEADHDAECPKQRERLGNGILGRQSDDVGGGLIRPFNIAHDQQTVAHVCLVTLEAIFRSRVVGVFTHVVQGAQRLHAGDDSPLVFLANVVDAQYDAVRRSRRDQSEQIGNADRPVIFLLVLVDPGDQVQAGGCRLGFPHGFDGGHF